MGLRVDVGWSDRLCNRHPEGVGYKYRGGGGEAQGAKTRTFNTASRQGELKQLKS